MAKRVTVHNVAGITITGAGAVIIAGENAATEFRMPQRLDVIDQAVQWPHPAVILAKGG